MVKAPVGAVLEPPSPGVFSFSGVINFRLMRVDLRAVQAGKPKLHFLAKAVIGWPMAAKFGGHSPPYKLATCSADQGGPKARRMKSFSSFRLLTFSLIRASSRRSSISLISGPGW